MKHELVKDKITAMKYFDRLPKAIRDTLNYSNKTFTPRAITQIYMYYKNGYSEEWIIDMIKMKGN